MDLTGIPGPLHDRVRADLAAVQAALPAASMSMASLPASLRSGLPRLFAASRFAAVLAATAPERFAQWLQSGAFASTRAPADIATAITQAVAASADEPAAMQALRELRNRELAGIALRAVACDAPLDATLAELSTLASACCSAAADFVRRALAARFGVVRDAQGVESSGVVLGMGKLGGGELNYSSDIDLILAYRERGESDGAKPLDADSWFERYARDFTRLLAQRTEHGFVYRVDWALRPFGLSGPPAMAADAIVDYYQQHGREWERYALIKASPVAGDLAAGRELLRELRPFVYRRYLDFNAFDNLREMKRKIEEEVARKGLEDNIKLGAGGIREVEFIVQAFQLIRGGHEKDLRDQRLRPVLRHLAQAGHLPEARARRLDECYEYLRRVENGLQLWCDEQVHALPQDEEARAALCAAMGETRWDDLRAKIDSVRGAVDEEFRRLFAERRVVAAASPLAAAVTRIWKDGMEGDAAAQALQEHGFGERAGALAQALRTLRDSRLVRAQSEASGKRLAALLPLLLERCAREADPATAALRVLDLVDAVAGRGTYVTLLLDSETARDHLVTLCAASPWIADLLSQQPVLLDALLDARTLYAPPDREVMRSELADALANAAPEDTEAAMNALRRVRQEVTLRVAAAERVHALPLVKVSDHLTWLAEEVLEAVLARVRAELTATHGVALRADGTPAQFAVIAYGKFGGIEMGYSSDLDIVFLHDCDALQQETRPPPGGGKALAGEVWLSRLAQRVIHWLSTQTSAGRAYEVDLELRPDGRRGLTAGSLAAFTQYQRSSAWTWEHQALTRARGVAGDRPLLAAFDAVRREVLTAPRDADKLRADVLKMRERMRGALDKGSATVFDVKQGRGGLTDIEFITQYLVLRHAHDHPPLVDWSDNWRQTDALVAARVLAAADGARLIECYRTYRAFLHAQALQQAEARVAAERFAAERTAVTELWGRLVEK